MAPSAKKTAARKKMRVATAFTGAATLAAALAPTAAVARTQQAGSPVRFAALVHKSCPAATSIHLATSTGGTNPNATSICVSAATYGGYAYPYLAGGTSNYFAACGGSYYGYYSGISKSGQGAHFKDTFGKGKTFWAFPHNGPIKDFTVYVSGKYAGGTEKC
jgi:hypothetical protein